MLDFNFLQLHLRRQNWRDYLKKDNPAAAALIACMEYKDEEKVQLKIEFLKMILRMRLDPARQQFLIGFFDTYAPLTWPEEEIVQQKLAEELPSQEVKEMTEILTSYHLRGREEGREEGKLTTLQGTLIRQLRRKLGNISAELEKQILKNTNITQLENALENIFDFDSEEALRKALN